MYWDLEIQNSTEIFKNQQFNMILKIIFYFKKCFELNNFDAIFLDIITSFKFVLLLKRVMWNLYSLKTKTWGHALVLAMDEFPWSVDPICCISPPAPCITDHWYMMQGSQGLEWGLKKADLIFGPSWWDIYHMTVGGDWKRKLLRIFSTKKIF